MNTPDPNSICCMITDNGSYRPESTLSLRELARKLTERTEHVVHPVSLLHSSKIDPEKLGGEPARIFEPFIKAKMNKESVHSFLVLPMFFGPSAAITEYLPQRVAELREGEYPDLEVRVAPCVVDPANTEDHRMAQILADLAADTVREHGLNKPALTVTDHGTPRKAVTDVRNLLAEQIAGLAGEDYGRIAPSSMERREGSEYNFNEPLLENLLGAEGFDHDVVIAMLFASPGRHAGPGGDVAQICDAARERHPELRTFMTKLVATHPGLVDLLVERFHQGLASEPVSDYVPG